MIWQLSNGVADILPLDHEDHHLGDVGGVVGDALQRFRDVVELHGAGDRRRVFDHEGQQFPLDLDVQVIDETVVLADLDRQIGVAAHKGIQRLLDHHLGPVGHAGDVDVRFERRLFVHLTGPLGDVGALVAHPFQVGDDLERNRDEAQIAGGRLAQRQQFQTALVDGNLGRIDLMIQGNGTLGQGVSRSTSDLTELAIISSTLPPMTRMLCFNSFNSMSNAVLMCSRSIISPHPDKPFSTDSGMKVCLHDVTFTSYLDSVTSCEIGFMSLIKRLKP